MPERSPSARSDARFPDSVLLCEIRRLRDGHWPAPAIVHARRWYWIFVRRYAYEICSACGRPVGRCTDSYWTADDALWIEIMGSEQGVLCPPCFTGVCRERGVHVYWKAAVDAR